MCEDMIIGPCKVDHNDLTKVKVADFRYGTHVYNLYDYQLWLKDRGEKQEAGMRAYRTQLDRQIAAVDETFRILIEGKI